VGRNIGIGMTVDKPSEELDVMLFVVIRLGRKIQPPAVYGRHT
jgi:hypothetical protein